jgi:hypothetical protein
MKNTPLELVRDEYLNKMQDEVQTLCDRTKKMLKWYENNLAFRLISTLWPEEKYSTGKWKSESRVKEGPYHSLVELWIECKRNPFVFWGRLSEEEQLRLIKYYESI